MARQRGLVTLEKSHMHLALNTTKLNKGGFSRTAEEAMQYLINQPHAEFQQ